MFNCYMFVNKYCAKDALVAIWTSPNLGEKRRNFSYLENKWCLGGKLPQSLLVTISSLAKHLKGVQAMAISKYAKILEKTCS